MKKHTLEAKPAIDHEIHSVDRSTALELNCVNECVSMCL